MTTSLELTEGQVYDLTDDIEMRGNRAKDLVAAVGQLLKVVFPKELPLLPDVPALMAGTRSLVLTEGQVYYLTCDIEVNGNRVKDLADAHGLPLEILFPKQLPLPPDAVALGVDLDHLWLDARSRHQYLAQLTTNPPRLPTFVHTCDFADGDKPEPKNVLLARRLDENLLRRLAELLTIGVPSPVPDLPDPTPLDDDELARIQLGSDGGPFCD